MESSVPIDRGWAWMIMAAAFMNLLLLIGISKCFGILFAELLELYGGSALGTSTMLALSAGLSLFLAPFVTTVSDRYTCRLVSMVGGIVCCLGFLVPAFCTSLEQVIISFGILTGLGYGICLTPSAIIVGRYFERHRSLVSGLMFCGSGVGGMLFPMILNYIIHLFGLHGALLVLAGLALQTVVFSALYRPPKYWNRRKSQNSEAGNEEAPVQVTDEKTAASDKLSRMENCTTVIGRRRLSSTDNLCRTGHPQLRPHASVSRLGDKIYNYRSMNRLQNGLADSTVTMYFSAMNLAPWLPIPEERFIDHAVQTDQIEDQVSDTQIARKSDWRTIFRRACLVKADDGSDLPLFDFQLLRNVQFVLFVICCMFVLASVYIGMIIPVHCQELGMTKTEVALLLSIQGGADMAGRLLTGFLGDRPWIKSRRKLLAALYCLICTISTCTSVFLATFWHMVAYLVVCSLAVGCFIPMIPVVLVDLVGIENLSRAWGLTALVEGFSVTLSPLIIGALHDWTLTYTSGLLFITVCFALGTLCILSVVIIDVRRQNAFIASHVSHDTSQEK